jgi:hypothetical protein
MENNVLLQFQTGHEFVFFVLGHADIQNHI